MLVPIIAAFAAVGGIIADKIILTYQKFGHRQFIIILFLFLFLLCAVLYPFFGKIDLLAFSGKYLILLLLIILIGSIYNVLYYHGIEKERISEVELITMLTPLSTIVMASIFLQTERNIHIFVAGLIACLALIFAHLRRHHLSFDNFQKGLLIYLLLYPIEAILIKNILFLYSPLALYMIRTLGILIIMSIWFFLVAPALKYEPEIHFSHLKAKNYATAFFISSLAVVQMVLTYLAYSNYGIVFTTIVLTLTPVLVYAGSMLILKEKFKKRIILSAIIILLCILYAHFSFVV